MQRLNIIIKKSNKVNMTTKSLIKQCYQNNLYFFVPYFLFLFLGSFVLLFTKKGEDIIFINQYNNSLLDIFFKYITYLGDGIFLAILLIPMLIIELNILSFYSFHLLLQEVSLNY